MYIYLHSRDVSLNIFRSFYELYLHKVIKRLNIKSFEI